MVRGMDAGIARSERSESAPFWENPIAVLGSQEWFSRADVVDRQMPRGSRLGAVKVWVLIKTCIAILSG